ncbi:MAG: hypothetical protein KDC19_12010 [Saprospiraceae bacterium]|nr:hypothetical protein [Saprospiraceae bacterium]
MSFDGTGGGIISQATAEYYMNNYQQGPTYTWNQGVKGHYFSKDFFQDLLGQAGAVGIRIYYGSKVNTSNVIVPDLIMVAVDSDGNDILSNEIIVDISKPCPPLCPTSGLGT